MFPLLFSFHPFISFSTCAFLHLGAGHGAHQLPPRFVLSFLHTALPNVNYVADFSVTCRNLAFLVTLQLGQGCQSPCSVTVSKGRYVHPVLVGSKREQLLALHGQFFSATGWSVVTEGENTFSRIQDLVYICGGV